MNKTQSKFERSINETENRAKIETAMRNEDNSPKSNLNSSPTRQRESMTDVHVPQAISFRNAQSSTRLRTEFNTIENRVQKRQRIDFTDYPGSR